MRFIKLSANYHTSWDIISSFHSTPFRSNPQLHLSSRTSRLTVGAVTTGGLGSIEVRVDAGVELVEEVGSVRSSGLVSLAVADLTGVVRASQTRALSGAVGVTLSSIAVGVNTRIGLVAKAGVVRTRGVRVALVAGEAGASGVVAGQTRASGVMAG